MSSTNRGGKRSPADFYPTPPYCVVRLLEAMTGPDSLPGGKWLEPCAGDGAIIKVIRRLRKDDDIDAVEIREECRPNLQENADNVYIYDFVSKAGELPPAVSPPTYSVVITNPPFSIAMEVIQRSMKFAPIVIMLLRMNYLESEDRCEFMRKHCPDLYVLPNRPSFAGDGSTDSITYAWFVWRGMRVGSTIHPHTGGVGTVQVLASTPKEHRTHNALDLLVPPR